MKEGPGSGESSSSVVLSGVASPSMFTFTDICPKLLLPAHETLAYWSDDFEKFGSERTINMNEMMTGITLLSLDLGSPSVKIQVK